MGCDKRPLKMTPSQRRSLAQLDKSCPDYNKAPNSTYEEFMRDMGGTGIRRFDGHVWCQKGDEIVDPTPLDDELYKKEAVCYGDRVYHEAPANVQAAVWLGLWEKHPAVTPGQLVESTITQSHRNALPTPTRMCSTIRAGASGSGLLGGSGRMGLPIGSSGRERLRDAILLSFFFEL